MKLIEKFKNNKTAKDSFLVLMANGISQVMGLLIVLIVSKVLSVAEYGVYTLLNNISSFVSDMADMGMNSSITRFVAEYRVAEDRRNEEQLIAYAIKRKIVSLVIVFVVVLVFAKPLAKLFLHDVSKYQYLYLVIFICGFSLFVGAMRAIIQGRQEYEKYFLSIVVWNSVWFVAMLLFSICGKLTITSSMIAQVLSGFVNLSLTIKLVGIDKSILKSSVQVRTDIKTKFNNFGNWMMLWSIFALLQSRLDVFMLATLTTAEQVSYYDIASKLIRPVLMVTSAYSQVLNPQFASIINRDELHGKIRSASKFILLVSVGIVLAIFCIKSVVILLFGMKYENSIVPCQMLMFAIIFFVWTIPFNSALYALNMPYVFTIAAFVGLVVTAIGNFFLLGKYGAIGASITFIAAQIVGLVIAVVAYIMMNRKDKNEQ